MTLNSRVLCFSFFNSQSQELYKLSRIDSLEIFVNSGITSDNTGVVGGNLYLLNILNHDLHISLDRAYIVGYGKLGYDKVYRTYYNLDTKKVNPPKVSITTSILFQDGLFIKNGSNGYVGNSRGVFKISNTKEVNVGSDKLKVLDIFGNFLSCKVDDNLIRYVEVNSGKTLNLATTDTNKSTFAQMTNYKLINSIAEAVFFKNDDSMFIMDNYTGKVTNTIPFVNGKLYFNKTTNLLYSLKGNNIFRKNIVPNTKPNNEIIVSQSYFLFGDTIQLTKPDIYFFKDFSWEVNGIKYYESQPKFQIKKAGNYDLKFSYVENGLTKTILKEKAILVVDSLKVKYTVNSQYGLVAGTPITFAASSNFENTSYKWEITTCNARYEHAGNTVSYYNSTNSSTSSTITATFVNMDRNSARLSVSNSYQTFVYNIDLQLGYNLLVNSDKDKGSTPLVVNLNALVACNTCNPVSNSSYGIIEFDNKTVSFKDTLNNYRYTFNKPGKYNVKIYCGISVMYNRMYSKVYNSVITVLDTTTFQAFPNKHKNPLSNNRYAMTQDAEGFYCEFEDGGEVQLFDSMGRLLKTYQIANAEYIRKEDLERGVYFLQINVNGEVYHEKILVE